MIEREQQLKRGQKVLSKILKNTKKNLLSNNPQSKYNKERPTIDSLEHYSHSEFSLYSQISQNRPTRSLPRKVQTNLKISKTLKYMTQDSILAQKARQFVNRLRKQKQYNEGKHLVRKKKQEQIKYKKQMKIKQNQQKEKSFIRESKYQQMMNNIVYHQERMIYRLRKELNQQTYRRYKTENCEQHQKYKISKNTLIDYEKGGDFPTLPSLKRRLDNINMDSL